MSLSTDVKKLQTNSDINLAEASFSPKLMPKTAPTKPDTKPDTTPKTPTPEEPPYEPAKPRPNRTCPSKDPGTLPACEG